MMEIKCDPGDSKIHQDRAGPCVILELLVAYLLLRYTDLCGLGIRVSLLLKPSAGNLGTRASLGHFEVLCIENIK